MAAFDVRARSVLAACRMLGLRVPEDVSLVGHDNTILAVSGNFSSVDLKTPSVGHAAIDLLTYAINGADKEPRRVIITPDMVHRNSTAICRTNRQMTMGQP